MVPKLLNSHVSFDICLLHQLLNEILLLRKDKLFELWQNQFHAVSIRFLRRRRLSSICVKRLQTSEKILRSVCLMPY